MSTTHRRYVTTAGLFGGVATRPTRSPAPRRENPPVQASRWTDAKRGEVALHEAAHILAAVASGATIKSVSIDRSFLHEGAITYITPREGWSPWAQAVVAMAGPMGSRFAWGGERALAQPLDYQQAERHFEAWEADFRQTMAAAESMGRDSSDSRWQLMCDAADEAGRLLLANLRALNLLSARLLERGQIGHEDVKQTLIAASLAGQAKG